MKKFASILMLALLPAFFIYSNSHADIAGVNRYEHHDHDTYELWFDTNWKNPAIVVWDLTAEEAILSDQSSNRAGGSFVACGSAKSASRNYPNSGYDRGHMCPNNDRDWSKSASKNTFRACNICPQLPDLNRSGGAWFNYEKYGHTLAKEHMLVTIVCGPYYDSSIAPKYIGKDNVRVPDGFFKVFVYQESGKLKASAFKFTQTKDGVSGTTLDWIEQMTGISIVPKEVTYD